MATCSTEALRHLRVFKKSSPNCKLTVYLGKRDFVDHLDRVDPPCRRRGSGGYGLSEGPESLRHPDLRLPLWPEDLDVLGLSFRKDLFISTFQAYPPLPEEKKPLTRLQERLIKKLGEQAHPFYFTVNSTEFAVFSDSAAGTGGHWEGEPAVSIMKSVPSAPKSVEEKMHKRNSVRLVIRKVQFAPEKAGPQPVAETTRHFLMSDRSLHLEASLDKELYYHGEPINVNVHVTNNTSKTVKRVKVSVRQYADICLFSTAQYKCPVAQIEQEVKEGSSKEVLGILVSYKVKVKLVVSRGGDVAVELPFVLMHPKPSETATRPLSEFPQTDVPVDTNLIEFETNFPQDDDIVFEDFARLRLKGMKDDKDDDEAYC
ncbi:unnamed protein product [Ranitomeya imitator]|uniref:Arrestin C-terminal-like domain-containing protein n=1 Tax=Ranitomeya imitator TaxID=111125 RepID=A0ABN9KQ04_9NEOB|nr:unnamed protein product [Ranitomeya imitator]